MWTMLKRCKRDRRGLRLERLEARQVLAGGSLDGAGFGTVTGRVWHDVDADGIQDTTEAGLPAIEVILFSRDLSHSWRYHTPADGSYLFNVPPGEYRAGYGTPAPTDWIRSPAGQGADEAFDSDAAEGEYVDITIESSGSVQDVDVGYVWTGRVYGRVWHDGDRDGVRDDGPMDAGVPRATVQLLDASLALVREIQTDEAGAFSFAGLVAGTYHVGYAPPAGISISPADLTEPDGWFDNDVDPATGRSQPFLVVPGEAIGSVHVGISGLGSIGGMAWPDFDGDGLRATSEGGIWAQQITLLDASLQPLASVWTDPAGGYRFADLFPGSYAISVPIDRQLFSPANEGQDDAIDSDVVASLGRTEPIALAAGQHHAADAGWMVPSGSVSFDAWNDTNRDGLRNESLWSFVGGIEVRLLDASGQMVASNATVQWSPAQFPSVTPGTYRLEIVTPPRVSLSPADQAGAPFPNSDFDPVTRQTMPFTISAGEGAAFEFSAGVFGTHSISGQVWQDTDGDGIRDPGEASVPDVQLLVEGFEDPAITPTLVVPWNQVVTDADGNYRLDRMLPAVYGISYLENEDIGSISPMNRGGDDALDSDFNPLLERTNVFRVDAEHSAAVRDLGLFTPAVIGGRAWNDVNRDGVRQAQEQPVSNLTVHLLDSSAQVVATKSTDSLGSYRFDGLAPGSYTVEIVRPTGTVLGPPDIGGDQTDSDFSPLTGRSSPITLLSGQVQTVDAGLFGAGGPTSISGTVWHDIDGDGVREPGELPAGGVVVNLWTSAAQPVATQTTAGDGTYHFANLAGGQYSVSVNPPAGATFAPIDRGGNEATDSDINRSTGRTVAFPLLVGQADVGRDAGLYSGPFSSDAIGSLRVTEIGFIGGGGSAAEFLELKNIGSQPLDLNGVALTRGVRFNFSSGSVRQLFPGEYVVVGGPSPVLGSVLDGTALLAGVYAGDLNQEERLTLVDGSLRTILDFHYDDDWFAITQDERLVPWTFTILDPTADRRTWSNRSRWRPSAFPQGTPGYDESRLGPSLPAPVYPPGTIVINEILTKSSDGFNDRIELHNTSGQTVNIGGWYLGDTEETRDLDDLTRYQIAPGTTIGPSGYLVLTRDEHFGNPDDPGTYRPFGLSSFGEAVNLTGVDSAGRLVGYSESHEYRGTVPDLTFGRYVTSTGETDFPALSQSTIGGQNTAPRIGPVVISEFMYKPSQYLEEYIELRNVGDTDVALGQEHWRVSIDGDVYCSPGQPTWGGFCFDADTVIPAGGYMLVVGADPDDFRRKYGIPAEIGVVGPLAGTLDGGGDTIELVRITPEMRSLVMDRVAYDDIFPWPEAADAGGVALERVAATAYGNDPANWAAARGVGGTPGRANTASAPVDINADGYVGLVDLSLLQANLGSMGPAFLAAGDLNADSVVNRSDVVLWLCNFGVSTSAPSAVQSPQAAVAIAESIPTTTMLRSAAVRRARSHSLTTPLPIDPALTSAVSATRMARHARLRPQAVDAAIAE